MLRVNHVALTLIKKGTKNALRWYLYIEQSQPWLEISVGAVTNPVENEKQKARAAASASGASYEIDLPDIQGPMVTRFPPEPSGYLHIGHAKAALLNDYFAHRKPGGTLICRFDDTNPSKESMEFQESIIHDLRLMNIVPDRISFSSDYFQEIYNYAIQLIKDGKAFADDSELGKGDEDRKNRLPSKRRNLSIKDTLARFEDMILGTEEGQKWCLRARIAYDSLNGTLRDPVIYRCNLTPHHRAGTAWKVYPTYDFCAPILDSIEGVTLALRTNEYRDRNVQYHWFQDALRLRKVPIWDFSRLNFIRTVLSKRKLTKIVDEGRVWGWDDPRMPTIRGIIRRGMTVPALREFILKQGPSRNILNLEWGAFWALNKKYIDPITPRHTAIDSQDVVRCTIMGVNEAGVLMKPKYHKNAELGVKKVLYNKTVLIEQVDAVTLTVDEEITLMNWGNVYVRSITRPVENGPITELSLELHLEGDVKKTKKVTWLAVADGNMVPVDLVAFDYLITKNKLEKTDAIEDCLTEVTEFRSHAFGDCNVAELDQGAIVQFERKGYYIFDGSHPDDPSKMVFFDIPSGKI
ncbi:glutamyl-tRNA synthetase [Stachybotrys elegans]|uniref:glutamate--tRNA ligase n=1 Tax=Stachybotrys elegans TaxID=80388 RepID=A0A8K0SV88_9HYPO|nr:glutamyl-tRNA synthetase [Stachybotrys elegans]